MKKILSLLIAAVLVLSVFASMTTVFAEDAASKVITVTLNGTPINFADQTPIMRSDRVLVPMRAIFEAMGAEITWEGETQTVWASKDDLVVAVQIDNNVLFKNVGSKPAQIPLDVPAIVENDRTMVPVRAITEAFGAKVDWDDANQTVVIVQN